MIYLAESANKNNRGLITSFASCGANIGFMLATLSYLLLKNTLPYDALMRWGWRLPFILAGLPGLLLMYYRFKLNETKTYTKLKSTNHLAKYPFITAIKYAPKQLLKIVGITSMSSTLYYLFFGFMPNYLCTYTHIKLKNALILQVLLLMLMLVFAPLGGYLGDRLTRKKMLSFIAGTVIILAIPLFYLIRLDNTFTIVFALLTATLLSSFDQGNNLCAVVENCPENIRYSGISFAYNLGNAVFGGTAPFIITLLTENISLLAPAFYLMIMSIITFVTASTLLPNNASLGPIEEIIDEENSGLRYQTAEDSV